MVKRLMLTVVMAAGGAGAYIYSEMTPAKKACADQTTAATQTTDESTDSAEWQVEYVDAEGNPIQRSSGLGAGLKATSNSLINHIPGLSTSKRVNASDCRTGSGKDGLPRTSGG